MKGVILAGGTGSRLFPLTKVTNKHLLPVGQKPMIFHPVEKLVQAGVRQILIVTGVEHMGAVVGLLGSGKDFGCQFTYRVQDEAGGIAQALGLAEAFVGSDHCAVILGDNIFEDDISAHVTAFQKQERGARILLKEVSDPQRFGVAELVGDKVVGIEEKPKSPKSHFAVTGVYFYDHEVFRFIRTLKPSRRGELEITDVNNHYIAENKLSYGFLDGWWSDAGTFESLARVNQLVARKGASQNQ
jgi:glucose-1-phosphate thymidylyltransferase